MSRKFEENAAVAAVKNAYQTKRLKFIRLDKNDEDAKAFFIRLLNDPEIYALAMTMLLRPQSPTTVEAKMAEYANSLLPLMICLPADNEGGKPTIIGELIIGEDITPTSLAQNRNIEMGFSLLPEHQNKGYGREAIDWALDWCFQHAGMHTVSIATVSYNDRAMHLYESMGFVNEGRKREVIWFNRKWYDSVLYSMTENEWEALRTKQGELKK
ncbi:hypothetical protein NLG97_g3751 [Lecanicillium saksenae]|uniref:Uncharacterized protein n=1 Tax=Lecanicillium saksenae TaxID=468837 RepID=A0ACC1QXT2_9HYPO|nr:hypothetical protein NLG97_g3751 [Lecanicillium saksenae]